MDNGGHFRHCANSHTRAFCMSHVYVTPCPHTQRMASCSWLPGVTENKLATNNCYSIYALPQLYFTDVMEAVGQGSTALAHRFISLHHHGTDGEYHSNSDSRDMHLSECTGGGCSYAALWHSTLNDSDHMHIALSSATSTCDGLEERPLRQTWRSACIKASKADQLHRGAIIMLGGTGADLSPVVVILDWHIGRPGICWHFTSVHQWQSSSNNNGIGMTGHLSQRGCVNS